MSMRVRLGLMAVLVLGGFSAAGAAGLKKLYVLDCGHGLAGDISRWTPGIDAGKTKEFVDSCYLLRHSQGWMVWDTGVPDALAAKASGEPPPDPKAVHWYRSKTVASQLDQLGIKPADVKFVAVSHTHPDHVGNVELFPQSMLLVQKAEYDWPTPLGIGRFKADHPFTKLEGDHDVFGDGSVVILSTPGHTPGHQSLLVKLPKTGALVLSGDLVHFKANWDARRVPSMNIDGEASRASMQRVADVLEKERGALWINHDKEQRDGLKMAPDYYD